MKILFECAAVQAGVCFVGAVSALPQCLAQLLRGCVEETVESAKEGAAIKTVFCGSE